ncbi:MAG: hypothetical protein WC197_01565, partial [Candidatus Gastranaerophilaceae bacterium]
GISKGLGALVGIVTGMFIARSIINKISISNENKNLVEKRKFSPKDLIAQFDDLVIALIYCKFSFLKNIHIDKLLPVCLAFCSFEAGKKHEQNKS